MNYHLKPKPNCKFCGGTGEYQQIHEPWAIETLLCDCVTDQIPESFDANKDTYDFEEKKEVKQIRYASLTDLFDGWTIDPKNLDEILFSLNRIFPMLTLDKEDLEDLLLLLSQMNIIMIERRKD
jgi:hypothetical protein